jgi:tellurium resistance protein TerD
MAINLTKGQRIEIGLSKVGVGLGWDPNEGTGFDFDLDASAFMLGENKKLPLDEFFVFYNNPVSPDGAVESSGDDTTGGSSDGDDETLTVDISKVDPKVLEIVFTVTIHDYETRKQNFGQVRNSFIRIYNAQTNEEIAK